MDSTVRIGGSGHTVFTWRGSRLAWLQVVSDTAPAPVAQPRAIQPLDAEHPVEIVTPRAVGAGVLRLTNFELWNSSVWQQLPGLERANSILDVFKAQVALGEISCAKVIKNPNGAFRVRNYYGCTITELDESETVSINTMEMPKGFSVMYTHALWV